MKKIFKILTSKIFITVILAIFQLAFMIVPILLLSSFSPWIYLGFSIFSIIVCIFIISKNDNPSYKLAWVFPILIFPLFGGFFYLFFGRQSMRKKDKLHLETVYRQTEDLYRLTTSVVDLPEVDEIQNKLVKTIYTQGKYPAYEDTQTTYYKIGEDYFEDLIAELEKAKRFIFLEFFIIERGKFWNTIQSILERKAAQGVDVRLLYDAFGCMFTLNKNFKNEMNEKGIKTLEFNHIRPTFDMRLNNRTHRKIVVIDGNISFTGGLNIADEYINEKHRFGHWKDTAMKFNGAATWSFTIMFLRFWMLTDSSEIDCMSFAPTDEIPKNIGGVQPLAGGPGKNHQLLEQSFLQMINSAINYVYINTPYLILDNELVTTLCLAAKSGVDVKITMPHIPDKKLVFMMSRSFYPVLLAAGVKIYEYTPGFVHAKSIVCDDKTAYIGTCNMDYRSFYLHHECGAILYNTESIADMKDDYEATLEKCEQISIEKANDVSIFTRLLRSILRLFAPLL